VSHARSAGTPSSVPAGRSGGAQGVARRAAGFPNRRGPAGAGEIILEYAIYHSPLPFIRTLLELGADPSPSGSRTAGSPRLTPPAKALSSIATSSPPMRSIPEPAARRAAAFLEPIERVTIGSLLALVLPTRPTCPRHPFWVPQKVPDTFPPQLENRDRCASYGRAKNTNSLTCALSTPFDAPSVECS
jgi:hypothetical protein